MDMDAATCLGFCVTDDSLLNLTTFKYAPFTLCFQKIVKGHLCSPVIGIVLSNEHFTPNKAHKNCVFYGNRKYVVQRLRKLRKKLNGERSLEWLKNAIEKRYTRLQLPNVLIHSSQEERFRFVAYKVTILL